MGSDIFNYSGRFFLSFGESMMIIFVPYVTYNDKASSGFKNVISDKDQSTSPDQVCFDRQMGVIDGKSTNQFSQPSYRPTSVV